MKVKPVDPTVVIRDPHTKQVLPADGGDVPENNFWFRRLRAGEVVRIDGTTQPVGNEPIAPLTTRGGK
jgi:uncharacterized protein DUF2635